MLLHLLSKPSVLQTVPPLSVCHPVSADDSRFIIECPLFPIVLLFCNSTCLPLSPVIHGAGQTFRRRVLLPKMHRIYGCCSYISLGSLYSHPSIATIGLTLTSLSTDVLLLPSYHPYGIDEVICRDTPTPLHIPWIFKTACICRLGLGKSKMKGRNSYPEERVRIGEYKKKISGCICTQFL